MLVRTGVNQWMDFGANDMCVCVFGMATVSRCSSKLFFNAIKMPLYCVQSVFQGFTVITFAQMLVICSLKKTKVAYAAAKQGVHTLPDGRVFEAGQVDTMARPLTCNISGSWV